MFSLTLAVTLHVAAGLPAQVSPLEGPNCPPAVILLRPVIGEIVTAFKPAAPAGAGGDVVLQWNEVTLQAIRADRTPPPLAARNLAIVHAAMYDAVNAITRTHAAYFTHTDAFPRATPEVAAAVAAHRSLVSLFPKQVRQFDAVLDPSLAATPDGPGKADGFRLGQHAAERLLAARERDGAATVRAYSPRDGVGLWRPTPPEFRAALLPQWPSVLCFCMKSGSQFRPAAAPALGSAAYWDSYREVKALGGRDSTHRTAQQTVVARFWADDAGTATPPGHWNQIAQTVARSRNLGVPENARLFALLNLALADAAIVSWDCKYHFDYWRPIEGIRAAPVTTDPQHSGDPQWTPLLTTPPFPTYTSGHSTFSGAGAAVLANFFGSDEVRFNVDSDGLPNVARSFGGFSAAAAEAGRSRIYGGIHWEFDNVAGLVTGRDLGDFVSRTYLLPRRPPG